MDVRYSRYFQIYPPRFFTRNGQGYAPADGKANLQSDNYEDFGDFMTTVLQYFEKERGIHFDFVSHVNEPQWDLKEKNHEGSPWQNKEIKRLVVALDSCISSMPVKLTFFSVGHAQLKRKRCTTVTKFCVFLFTDYRH